MKLLPGVSFSWRRALGYSAAKGRLSRRIGIPLTRSGRQKKLGRSLLRLFGLGVAGLLLPALAGAQEQTKLEPLYRAAKETQAAVKSAVTNPRLRELVEHFQAELSVADDRASTPAEKSTVAAFRAAYTPYADSREVWSQKIDLAGHHFDGTIMCSAELNPKCQGWIKTYDLKLESHPPGSLQGKSKKAVELARQGAPFLVADEIMQAMWAVADLRMATAVDSYMGRKPAASAAK